MPCRLGRTLDPELEREVEAIERFLQEYGMGYGCKDLYGCENAEGISWMQDLDTNESVSREEGSEDLATSSVLHRL